MFIQTFNFEVDSLVFGVNLKQLPHMQFWQDVSSWLNIGTDVSQILIYMDGLSTMMSHVVNLIMTLAKYHIHTSKLKQSKASLHCFKMN